MHTVTKAILADNQGRDPERLKKKLAAMRADPFSFYRGTAPLFYRSVPFGGTLRAAPCALVCGDLHLQNFGSYKGDNRLIYFDINDFDEACVAPVSYELVRFLASVLVGAHTLGITQKLAGNLATQFVDTYAANVASAKPRWVERALATGPVRTLLRGLRGRTRRDLIASRTQGKPGKIKLVVDGKRTLPADKWAQARARAILASHARQRSVPDFPDFFEPLDVARRISGNGSLGLERYVVLTRGRGGRDGYYLIDIKLANTSALPAHIRTAQPRWPHEAARVLAIQQIAQAISPALLGAVRHGKRSYLVKEMQPTADRVDLPGLRGNAKTLGSVIHTMAEVSAWAHLRGCGRYGAATMDEMTKFARNTQWQRDILRCAHRAHEGAMQQWENYTKDYDDDRRRFIDPL